MQQKWEYRLLSMMDSELVPEGTNTYSMWMDEMNDLGDLGWQAVGIVQELGGRTDAKGLWAGSMSVLMKREKRD